MILACICMLNCICVNATAVNKKDSDYLAFAAGTSTRATSPFKVSISAGGISKSDTALFLAVGEAVTIRASYTPKSASVDFGLLDANNDFYFVSAKSGSINVTLRVPNSGNYYFAIRNGSDATIDVTGNINY